MSQNDYTIANQSAPDFRSDLNDALQALASLSSGSTAPSPTYANMLWYDTGNNILKMRTEADDAWINIGYLDQSANAFRILDDTQVVNTSGTQTGLLGGQATSVWEDGTSTTRSLVSPAEAKAAVESVLLAEAGEIGSYVFARSTADVSFGATVSGENLFPTSSWWKLPLDAQGQSFPLGSPLSGTWRCMGEYKHDLFGGFGGATLWQRVA